MIPVAVARGLTSRRNKAGNLKAEGDEGSREELQELIACTIQPPQPVAPQPFLPASTLCIPPHYGSPLLDA
jgi:hypothetical protein